MKQEERMKGREQDILPEMPPAFSEAVDKALFTAIRQENGRKEQAMEAEKRAEKKTRGRRFISTAAALVLVAMTALTLGLGLGSRKGLFGAAGLGDNSQKLDVIPLYDSTFPEVTRYDVTKGYVYADELLDLVQTKLAWLKETEYDELWLLAVEDLSQKDFSAVTYREPEKTEEVEGGDITGWMHTKNTLYALVQFEFGGGDGPMLVECDLDERGKPTSCTIKALSCDPELEGMFSNRIADYTSPAGYIGYGTGSRKGLLTCGGYTVEFTSALPLEQVEEKLADSAHKEHIREWHLYTAPTEPEIQLWTETGEEKVVCKGAVARQTMSCNEDIALRVTFDGEILYTKGTQVQDGLNATEKGERIRAYAQKMSWAWDEDYPDTFLVRVNQWQEHTMTMETNLPNATVEKVYVYQNTYGNQQWITDVPQTVAELLQLEPDKGENIVCFLVESEGREYVFSFSMYLRSLDGLYENRKQAGTFTPGAKRYDLTGGFVYSEKLLDAVEAKLQSQGISYEELWLEAVYDFDGKYELEEKRYGSQMWMTGYEGYCLALVQYDFSEGAGPMLVSFDYDAPDTVARASIVLESVDPNVDSCYGIVGETDDPYTIAERYYCMGTEASRGMVRTDRAVLRFTSQLPLEQVQEIVKDSPYKDAAREWYLLPLPDVGEETLYDANGQERTLRRGNTVYDGNYAGKIQEPYVDQNA